MSSDADPVHPKEGLVVRAKRMLDFQFHNFNKTELRIKLNKHIVKNQEYYSFFKYPMSTYHLTVDCANYGEHRSNTFLNAYRQRKKYADIIEKKTSLC